MQQIICFVGPDRCGKTNISQRLSEKLQIPRYKASTEKGTFIGGQSKFLQQLRVVDPRQLDLLKQVGFSMIMDRGWCCEFPYSKFFNRETDLVQLSKNDKAYADLGAKIVFCCRSSYAGIVDDLDPNLNGDALQTIHNYYLDYFDSMTACPVIYLNVDDEDLDREVAELCRKLHL